MTLTLERAASLAMHYRSPCRNVGPGRGLHREPGENHPFDPGSVLVGTSVGAHLLGSVGQEPRFPDFSPAASPSLRALGAPNTDLLLEHAGFVRALARALVGPGADADDLAQDACIDALRAPAPRKPRAFLAALVHNRLRSTHRGDTRRRAREQTRTATARTRAAPSAADVAATLEIQRRVVTSVTRLPDPERGLVVARFYEDETVSALARRFGLSRPTVRAHLARALDRMRADLDKTQPRRAWIAALATLASKGALAVSLKARLALLGALVLLVATPWLIHSRRETAPRATGPEMTSPRDRAKDPGQVAGTDGDVSKTDAGVKTPGGVFLVRDARDGRPLPGAYIVSEDGPGGAPIQTDADGRAAVPAGEFRVVRTGYRVVTARVRADETLPLFLEPGVPVNVRVIDITGQPIDGARIDASDVEDYEDFAENGRTDRRGLYEIPAVRPLFPFELVVQKAGYGRVALTLRRGEAGAPVEIVLGRGGTLEGRVVDAHAIPVAGADVFVVPLDSNDHMEARAGPYDPNGYRDRMNRPSFAKTDATGRYTVRGLPPGRYNVVARAKGEREGTAPWAWIAGPDTTATVDIALRPLAAIDLNVRYDDGSPCNSVYVEIVKAGRSVSLDPLSFDDGKAALVPEETGKLVLDINSKDAVASRHEVELAPGQRVPLRVVARRGRSLKVQVVSADGAPVAKAWLSFRETEGSEPRQHARAITDAQGFGVLKGLREHSGTLAVRSVFGGHRTIVRKGVPTNTPIRIDVTPLAAVSGRIERPAPNRRVRVYVPELNASWYFRVKEDGTFTLRQVPPDRTVHIHVDPHTGAPRRFGPITLSAGETHDLGTIPSLPGVTLAGVVRDDRGRPIDGARLEIAAKQWSLNRYAFTDAGGRFSVPYLPALRLAVFVSAKGHIDGRSEYAIRDGAPLHLRLVRAGRLVVSMREQDGNSSLGQEISARQIKGGAGAAPDQDAEMLRIGFDGTGEAFLKPGRYRVRPEYDDDVEPVVVELKAGETRTIRFQK